VEQVFVAIESKGNKIFTRSKSSRAMSKRTAKLMSIQEGYTQAKKAGYDRLILLLPTKDLQNTITRRFQCMLEDITQLGGRHSQQQYFWCHHLSYRRPTP